MSVSYLSGTQALGIYDVKDFGAVGNGVADDTAAIQAACLAAHTAGGGTVVFPPGTYKCDGTLDLRAYNRVELRGMGNASHIGGAAVLRYTGTAATFLSLHSSFAVKLRNLRFEYTNAAFAGDLIGYGWYAGGGFNNNADPGYGEIDGCYFAGDATHTSARSGIMLDHAIIVNIHDCHFSYMDAGILGRSSNTLYAIVIQVRNCVFTKLTTAGIKNPHQAWTIECCTSEPLLSLKGGFIWMDTTYSGQAIHIRNNWVGDASVNGGTIIRINGLGITIDGANYLSGSGNGATGDKLIEIHSGAVSDGIVIESNFFVAAQYGIDFAGAAHRGYEVDANYFSLTTPITGTGSLSTGRIGANDWSAGNLAETIIAPGGLTVTAPTTLPTVSSITINGAGVGTTLKRVQSSTVSVDPPSIAANSKSSIAVTVTGAAVGDHFVCEPPAALEAGLIYVGCRVTGADTLTIYLANITAGAIDGVSRTWDFTWFDFT